MKRKLHMRLLLTLLSGSLFLMIFCRPDSKDTAQRIVQKQEPGYIRNAAISDFIDHYPKYKPLAEGLKALYSKDSSFICFDSSGLKDFARVVYNNAGQMGNEGLLSSFPYQEKYTAIFDEAGKESATPEAELLISSLYLYYNRKVYMGIDTKESTLTGWHLPREKVCFSDYRDSISLSKARSSFLQYNNLKKGLQKYLEIEKSGGWGTIEAQKELLPLKPGDTSVTISQIRRRLFAEGYLPSNSGSNKYDIDLITAVAAYRERQYKNNDSLITGDLIADLNITLTERIKCIAVNMERCRWIPSTMNDRKEFIAVNIPSFRLHYFRDGKPFLISKVVVGKEANKTVVFSGELSYIVFSPYWNVPNSIFRKEIAPEIKKNRNYLREHDMEWVGNKVRQRPGAKNPLGLVKFMFPNSNNIYLHDTPSKSLFNKDERAFSHGCIRVERARELAIAIMANDRNWSTAAVDAAMAAGRENSYSLTKRIPVYIAYFTAWADSGGNVSFFDDIYKRDQKLAELLFDES